MKRIPVTMLMLGYSVILIVSLLFSYYLLALITNMEDISTAVAMFLIPFLLYSGFLLIATKLMQWFPHTKNQLEPQMPLLKKIYMLSFPIPLALILLAVTLDLTGLGNPIGLLMIGQLLFLPLLILLHALREDNWLRACLFSLGILTITLSSVVYVFLMVGCQMEIIDDEHRDPEPGECESLAILSVLILFGLLQVALGFRAYKNKKRILIATFISSLPAILFWGVWAIQGWL